MYEELRSLRADVAPTSTIQSAESRQNEDRLVSANAEDAEDLGYEELYEATARVFALEHSLRQDTPDSKSK